MAPKTSFWSFTHDSTMHSLRFHAFLFSKMRFLPGKKKNIFSLGEFLLEIQRDKLSGYHHSLECPRSVVAHIVIFYDIFNPRCRKVIQDHVLLYGIIFSLFSLSPSLNKTSRFLILYFPAASNEISISIINQCSFVNAMENPPTSKVSHSGSIEPSPLSVPNAERGNHAWCL